MLIRAEVTILLVFIVVIFFISCNAVDGEIRVPAFSYKNETLLIDSSKLSKGISIILKSRNRTLLESDIIGNLNNCKKDVGYDSYNLLLTKESNEKHFGWTAVVDKRLWHLFDKAFPEYDLLVFKDGELVLGSTLELANKRNIYLNLQKVFYKAESMEEVIKRNRPENTINVKSLYDYAQGRKKGIVLRKIYLISKAKIKCDRVNIIKHIDHNMEKGEGIICFGTSFNKYDINLITHNFSLKQRPIIANNELTSQLSNLRRINVEQETNIEFNFDEMGRFVNSSYLISCVQIK